MKYLIFGHGRNGTLIKSYIEKSCEGDSVVGFVDNSVTEVKDGVFPPDMILSLEFDKVIISNAKRSQVEDIQRQLASLGVPSDKQVVFIDDPNLLYEVYKDVSVYDEWTDIRIGWLRAFAGYAQDEGMCGSVAECGVNRGDFAHYINKYFPRRRLWLFDTFNGFNEADLDEERKRDDRAFTEGKFNSRDCFRCTSEQIVMHKMVSPDMCVIRKGFFPDTAADLDREFAFVNLDMDLYAPTKAGLEIFYPRMVRGGVILIHDYYRPDLPGIKASVHDYEAVAGHLLKFPIGDGCSIAIIKE